MRPHKVIQLAYGEMATDVLTALLADPRFEVSAIVTPPMGANIYRRGPVLKQEEVAENAVDEILRTNSLNDLHDIVVKHKPDLVLIATFQKIIPERTLVLSRFVNIHHGKLPRQRGRANINWAIINGEPSISVSVHEAVTELDAGDIIHQFHFDIGEDDDISSIYRRINATLTDALADLLDDYLADRITLQAQDQTRATYYPTRIPDDGLIDWSWPARRIQNIVRALRQPFPGAFTYLDGEKITVWSVRQVDKARRYEGIIPGRVVGIHKGIGVEVLTGDGPLLITDAEGAGFKGDPSAVIGSTKTTLGIRVQDLLNRIAQLEQGG